jgi:hypothetical protein
LLALLDHAVSMRFVRPEQKSLLCVSSDHEAIVADLMVKAGRQCPNQPTDFERR